MDIPFIDWGLFNAAETSVCIAITQLGTVTSNDVEVGGNNWVSIEDWKNKYDTAIEKLIL